MECLRLRSSAWALGGPTERKIKLIVNTHQRTILADCPLVGQLIDTLGAKPDRLWPIEKWPPIRFDRSIQIGASGGHGPIRYTIDRYNPGQSIRFRFLSPRGFHGTHRFEVVPSEPGKCKLIHTLEMITSGMAILSWPVIYRPLHDALLEDLLDKAERIFSDANRSRGWSSWVKFLRWCFRTFKKGINQAT